MEILYLIIAILIFQIFIITLLNFKPRESCCDGKACCKEKVEGLSNPIPQEEFCCKDDMSNCSCDEPFIIEGINDFERKTEITGMGGRGGPVDSIRSRNNDIEKQNESYNKMIRESEDYIDPLDEDDFEVEEEILNEPLEENDPNIHKK
tara:strand:- start:300 stop:746 length:447 start_codon:yes stop_codon:yes gene_type:complete